MFLLFAIVPVALWAMAIFGIFGLAALIGGAPK
jgi:hypothetical protein